MQYLLAVVFIFTAVILPASADEVITIHTTGPQKQNDASHDYFISLLSLALNSNNPAQQYQIKNVPHAGQARVLKLMEQGRYYDVIWSGYSAKRTQKLIHIPFPLFKGGLGIRGAIIRKDDTSLSQIQGLDDLRNKVICQGLNWPDAVILKNAKLNVVEVNHFDAMLKMVALKRCDLLPLSIFEGQSELNAVQELFPNLIFSTNFLITYYLEMNFYVNKSNQALADKITAGLEKLAVSGKFNAFMAQHSLTKNAFPLSRYVKANQVKLNALADQQSKTAVIKIININIENGITASPHASFYNYFSNSN
ncbi:MAG: substrate-binding periplasmic protein [Thalassotalea sp.]